MERLTTPRNFGKRSIPWRCFTTGEIGTRIQPECCDSGNAEAHNRRRRAHEEACENAGGEQVHYRLRFGSRCRYRGAPNCDRLRRVDHRSDRNRIVPVLSSRQQEAADKNRPRTPINQPSASRTFEPARALEKPHLLPREEYHYVGAYGRPPRSRSRREKPLAP